MSKHKLPNLNTYQRNRLRKLVDMLKIEGYTITIIQIFNKYILYEISGMGIKGQIFDGCIFVDNDRCFNKPNQCPIRLPLPASKKQRLWLLERMRYWASDNGYQTSNSFCYEWFDLEYPFN